MISVCITTYNSSKYILEQLNSITSQLSADDEIVVSDDGSKDGTLNMIAALNDARIKVFRNEGEHGYTPNFENALNHAKGDYVFLSDHDDVWKPNKVEVCMKWLQDYDYVVHDAVVTDEQLETTAPSYFNQRVIYRTWWGNMYRFGFLGCLHAFRRSVLRRALPFPSNHRYCTHDNWLYMIGQTYYKVKVIDEQLMYYRRHDGTTSEGGVNEHKPTTFRIAYRLYLVWKLMGRCLNLNYSHNSGN